MENTDNLIPSFDDLDEFVLDLTGEEFEEKKSENEEEAPEVETEEPIVETVEEETEEPAEEEVSDEESTVKALYDTLVGKGILYEDKEFKPSWEGLESMLETLPDRIAEDMIESAPDVLKKVLEFGFASGENITKESLKGFMQTYLEDLDNAEKEIDVSTVEGARSFMKEHLSKTLRPVAVEAALDAMEDDGSLMTEAKAETEKLKQSNNHQKLIDDKIRENEQIAERTRQRSLAIQKELNSEDYDKPTLNTIVNVLRDNKISTIIKNAWENPKAYVQLAYIMTKFDENKKEFNFDSFVKEAKSSETQAVRKSILKDSFSSLPKTSAKKDVNQNKRYDSIEPIIEF